MELQAPAKVDLIKTKDEREYKVERDLFCKYSPFYKTMIQDSDEQVFYLFTIHSTEFDYLFQFLQLHKKTPPLPVAQVQPGVSLKSVMEQADAELIYRIFQNPPEKVKGVINAAFFLHMNQLLKRLTAGMIAHLDKGETKQLIKESKKNKVVEESEVSTEIHNKIKLFLKNKDMEAEEQKKQQIQAD